jgi:hypothetical protein
MKHEFVFYFLLQDMMDFMTMAVKKSASCNNRTTLAWEPILMMLGDPSSKCKKYAIVLFFL